MVLIIKIKRKIALSLAMTTIWGAMCAASASGAPSISAQAAVLMHDGRVIYGKNENTRLPMASTTKLMTAILAIENAEPYDTVKITEEHCFVEGSSMYLKPGSEKTVLELLKGLMLVSGNDAALALASHTAGDTESFVELMNRKAAALGMKDTHFANPHGLSHPEHYSTARDMAVLMEYCMENELFARISSMKSFDCDGAQLLNHNKLLFICEGCTGGKTGYTMASGRCLVSSCEREGTNVVCVTLSAPDDWNDHMAMYNWCFDKYSPRSVTEGVSFTVPVITAGEAEALLVPGQEKSVFVEDTAELRLDAHLPWFVFEPVKKGEIAGNVSICVDGESLGEYYLIYSEDKF